MSFDEVYKSMLLKRGGSVLKSDIKNSKDSINNKFKDDPSYKLAKLKKKDINADDSDLDTRIVNVNTDVYKKKIYVRPNTNIDAGDYIIYPNKTYLILSVEDNLISPYANSTFCNYILKWMINGEYFETNAIVTNNTKYTLGIKEVGSSITEGNGMFGAIISYDDKAKKIPLGERFVVNGQAWEATQLDHSSVPNVLSILLGESSKSTEYDDMENEIADKWLHSYEITLNSASEILVETSTHQIIPTITNNGVIVSNPTITYLSSNTSIATVNSNGLVTSVSVGNCIITASIGSTTMTLDLVVTAKTVENIITYGVEWSSTGTTLKTYVASTAQCAKYINGVKQDGLVISYEIDSVGKSLVNTSKITITQPSSSSVQIRNKSVSSTTTFTIIIKDSSDGTVITNQVITLTGM